MYDMNTQMNKRLIFGIFLIIVGLIWLLNIGESFGQLLILSIGIYFCLIGASQKIRSSKKKIPEEEDNLPIKDDS